MTTSIQNDGVLEEGRLIPWVDIKDLRLVHYRGKLERVLVEIRHRTLIVEPRDVSVDLTEVARTVPNLRVRRLYVEPAWPNYLLVAAVWLSILRYHRLDWLFIPILLAYLLIVLVRRPVGLRISDLAWGVAIVVSGAYFLPALFR